MYYMKELASLWIAYGEVKVLKKVKNSEEEGEKSSKRVRIRKTIFSALKKKDRSDLRTDQILTSGKANPSLKMLMVFL